MSQWPQREIWQETNEDTDPAGYNKDGTISGTAKQMPLDNLHFMRVTNNKPQMITAVFLHICIIL